MKLALADPPPPAQAALAPVRVDVRGLSKSFALHGRRIDAVEDVSFTVRQGEFVSLLGPSGSGKSTVLNMIATLLAPTGGSILIDGKAVVPGRTTPQVGYVYQKDTLFPWRTVADNIGYGLELAGLSRAERRERVARAVARVGLTGFEAAYPASLSGGMRQRASLMRTLVREPEILLMDEPFGPLDAQTRQIMGNLLLDLWAANRKAVMFVTHDLEEAIALADRVVVLSAGPAAKIVGEFKVDLARPRDISEIRLEPHFHALYKEIWSCLRVEVSRAYAGGPA